MIELGKFTGLFVATYLTISIMLIINLWQKHPKDSAAKKLFWTFVLVIPIIGWIFYGGMYESPAKNQPDDKTQASGWGTHLP